MISNAVVLDTKLIFSALTSKAFCIRDILFDKSMIFYALNYLITEIYRHKEKLQRHSKIEESEFYKYLNGIIERIRFIPTDTIIAKRK